MGKGAKIGNETRHDKLMTETRQHQRNRNSIVYGPNWAGPNLHECKQKQTSIRVISVVSCNDNEDTSIFIHLPLPNRRCCNAQNMVVSARGLPLFSWLTKYPSHSFRIIKIPFIPLRLQPIYCSITTTYHPSPTQLDIANNSNKWEASRKKKVVMRVGYVGSDYRGWFQIPLSSLFIYLYYLFITI